MNDHYAECLRQTLAKAPPLTNDQRHRLRTLLTPPPAMKPRIKPCPRCSHPHAWHTLCQADIGNKFGIPCSCAVGAASPDKPYRPNIPARIRRAVIERDGLTCTLCGIAVRQNSPTIRDRLTLDHIIPVSAGGPDTIDNLRVCCFLCNVRRGDRCPDPDGTAAESPKQSSGS